MEQTEKIEITGLEYWTDLMKIYDSLKLPKISNELKSSFAKFLYICPLSEKQLKIFNNADSQIGYLIKVIIKEYLKNGLTKSLIDLYYEQKRWVKLDFENAKLFSDKLLLKIIQDISFKLWKVKYPSLKS